VNDGSPIAKLGLGTAQFGLAYGVTNERGRVPESEAGEIVAAALAAGFDLVDTAAAYGDSEEVLGRVLSPQSRVRIVSKLPPVLSDRIGDTEIDDCRAAVARSLARLRRTSLDALLLHRPDELRKPGGEKLARLLSDLKQTGTVAKIGISAYDRAQIDLSLERLPLDVVQVPVNLLDQRLLRDATLDRLKRGNVEIHARSAFLQGVLLADPANLPAYFVPHLDRLRAVGITAERAGLSHLALCLRFVLAQPAVDRVIVGVTSLAELRQIVDAATIASPLPDGLGALAGGAPDLVDPSRWPA
jgi:aryl-alcohol dehydrogenase-like predicted oxidoreductase